MRSRLSSNIPSYPGREITPADIEAERYLYTHYEAKLRYAWTSGVAISRFLDGLKEAKIWGRRCHTCGRTMVPPRMYCEECFRPNDEWVRLRDTGRVLTYSVSYVNVDASRRKSPILVAVIEIDGASPDMGILHLLGKVEPAEIRVGLKVKAVWKPRSERRGAITDIRYFRPV